VECLTKKWKARSPVDWASKKRFQAVMVPRYNQPWLATLPEKEPGTASRPVAATLFAGRTARAVPNLTGREAL